MGKVKYLVLLIWLAAAFSNFDDVTAFLDTLPPKDARAAKVIFEPPDRDGLLPPFCHTCVPPNIIVIYPARED